MRRLCLIVAAVLLVPAVTAMRAQQFTGSVVGTVKDQDGNPAGGLVLSLEPMDRSATVPQQIKVNKKGKFAHRFLPAARYRVNVEGSEAFIESMVYVIRDSGNLQIDRLEAKAHPERGLPPIQVMAGQQGSLDLILASESYRAELSQRVGIAEASDDLQEASDLLNAGQAQASLEKVNEILAGKPDLGTALYLRGAALFRLGRLVEAEDDLRRAVEAIPEQPGVSSALGDVLLMRADALRKEESTRDEAVALFGEAADLFEVELAREPGVEQVLRNRLIALQMAGRRDELKPALEQLIEVAPSDGECYLQLAELAAEDGNHAEALAALERMPAKSRDAVSAMFNLAVDLYNGSRYDEAMPIVERAIELDPELPEPHRLAAGIRLVQGDREGAIRGLRRFLELAPQDAPDLAQARQLLEALQAQAEAESDQ